MSHLLLLPPHTAGAGREGGRQPGAPAQGAHQPPRDDAHRAGGGAGPQPEPRGRGAPARRGARDAGARQGQGRAGGARACARGEGQDAAGGQRRDDVTRGATGA